RKRNKSLLDRSTERSKEKIKALSSSFENSNKDFYCPLCHIENKKFKMEKYLYEHFNGSCVMYCHCPLCSKSLEIKKLNHHLQADCSKREQLKTCKRCKEPVLYANYNK